MGRRVQVKDGKIVVPEKVVLRQCLNYLTSRGYEPGVDFGRVNTAGTYDAKIECYRRNPWLFTGMPDIFGFKKTGVERIVSPPIGNSTVFYSLRMFAIECKSAKGKLSSQQEAWRDKFIASGGLYILAYSIDDISKIL